MFKHNNEVIETAGVGLKILVEVCEFSGSIGIHFVHSGGKTVEHRCQSGRIRCIRCRGLRSEVVGRGGTSLRPTTLVCGFCSSSGSFGGSWMLLRRHLPLYKPSRARERREEERIAEYDEDALSEVVGW